MILYNVLLFTNTSNRIISILQYIRPIIKSLPLMTNLQGEWQAFSYAPVGKNFICFIYLQSIASTADLVWANTIDTPRWKLYRYFSITEESLAYENQQLMLESIFNFITQTFSALSSTSEIWGKNELQGWMHSMVNTGNNTGLHVWKFPKTRS